MFIFTVVLEFFEVKIAYCLIRIMSLYLENQLYLFLLFNILLLIINIPLCYIYK